MKKLEHIGIAVRDLEKANVLFAALLGRKHYKIEEVASEGVRTSFFEVGGVKIELLEALNDSSPIARFLQNRGEGIHHLAFEVDHIDGHIPALREEGFQFVSEKPVPGADHKRVCFLHPRSTNGVLIELCEEISS